jgi:MFS family permease
MLVSAIVFVESLFFATLTPLLPHLADEFGLSKTGSGILTAAYSAGAVAGAIPGGLLATRAGVKAAVLIGVALMSSMTAVFGFASSEWLLDLTRFGQGFGSSLAWTGGLAWLISAAPRERRGELIGITMGAAIVGTLLGPVLGGAAALVGRAGAFNAVALLGLVLAVWAWRTAAFPPGERQPLRALFVAVRRPGVSAGIWLLSLPALLYGALSVLAPLKLAQLGLGAVAIGTVFLISAALQAASSVPLGRWSDRRGRLAPVRMGLLASIAISLALPWIDSSWTLAATVVVANLCYAVFWVPGTALLSDASEAAGLDFGFGFALLNLGWAPGHVIGSTVGGALADASSDLVSYLLLAAICLATLVTLNHRTVAAEHAASQQQSDKRLERLG